MPAWELAQLALGLCVPLMLIPHVFGTRVAASMLGVETTYPHVVGRLFSNPETLIRQPLLLLIVWGHLVLGLHYWLRLRAGYRRWLPVIYRWRGDGAAARLAGLLGSGIRVAQDRGPRSRGEGRRVVRRTEPPTNRCGSGGQGRRDHGSAGGTAGAPGGAQGSRVGDRRRHAGARAAGTDGTPQPADAAGTYRIVHAGGRTLIAHSGQSLLEALREARIPHASVCGGRARCTTCRVRVGRGLGTLPAPNSAEMLALQRIHAEPNVRLACQLRPNGDLQITPLLPAHAGAADANQAGDGGRERAVAVMFVDLRDSSRLAEHRLPYDVLFILNRFFAEMADALEETGGYYSTFKGDGFMALYGTTSDLAQGCRDALRGAIAVSRRLTQINVALASELREPLRVGISVHAGEAIVGTMGPPTQPIVSALGDTVNVASRLEGETKSRQCALVVSAACAQAAGIDLSRFPEHTVRVRGRAQSVSYYAVAEVAALASILPSASDRADAG